MIELGLQRISRLLAGASLPWRAVHVAGTNGKGSICAHVSDMLDVYNRSAWRHATGHAPLKHARFTSPHLIDRWDCITVDQEVVRAAAFRDAEQAVLRRNEREGIGASEFEVLTATAFEVFTREQVDVGVVEVGMGGRLDATNVIGQAEDDEGAYSSGQASASPHRPAPLVTAISSIGLDHQAFLGDTLAQIAREKAGIVKPRVPVVYAPNAPEVTRVISQIAHERRSPLYAAVEEGSSSNPPRSLSALLDYLEAHHSPHPLPEHSRINARVAFTSTCLALQQLGGLPVDVAQILQPSLTKPTSPAIAMFQIPWQTTFPGRLQPLSLAPLTTRQDSALLDGAHNAQSAQALAAELQRLHYRRPITWVLAASDSKPAREILAPLLRAGDKVYAVEFGPVAGMPWVAAQRSGVLARAARELVASPDVREYGSDVAGALRAASAAAEGGPLVVAGSLYLVGDVLRLLREAGSGG